MRAEAEALGAPALEERIAQWADRFSDRVNPLIVKEVRQGLRTRVFWISFTLLLLACLVISLIAYVAQSTDDSLASGPTAFTAYFACLGFVHFLVLPYTAYRSLLRERDDDTWVLLTLTGMGPRRILRGKLGSTFVQALLYGSAVMPFLMLSYYLNGIDLVTVLLVVGLGIAYHAFLTCVALSMATWAENRVFRAAVGLFATGGLFVSTTSGLQLAYLFVHEGQKFIRDSEFLVGIGAVLLVMLTTAVLMFEIAVARLSLATENYTAGPRIALLFQLLCGIGSWTLIWALSRRDRDIVVAMQIFCCAYLLVAGMFMAIEADGQAARHRAVRGLKRIFTPGSLRGLRFVAALVLLCTGASLALLYLSKGRSSDTALFVQTPAILSSGAYTLLYLSLPIVIARGWQVRALESPVQARMLLILLALLGMGVSPLVGAFLGERETDIWLNAFNPAIGLFVMLDRPRNAEAWLVAFMVGSVAVLTLAWAHHILRRRDRKAAQA